MFLEGHVWCQRVQLEGKGLIKSPGAGSDSYSLLGAMNYLRRQSGSIEHTSGKMTVKNQKGTKTHLKHKVAYCNRKKEAFISS